MRAAFGPTEVGPFQYATLALDPSHAASRNEWGTRRWCRVEPLAAQRKAIQSFRPSDFTPACGSNEARCSRGQETRA